MTMDNIYNNEKYLSNNPDWHQKDSPYKFSLIQKIIKRNNIIFDNCADIGCGAGYVTEFLAKNYLESKFVGFDNSSDAKNFWKNRTKLKNLIYKNRNIKKNDKSFDIIICLDVFEHVEDYFCFLKNLKISGDKFIFNIPLDMSVMKLLTNGIKLARTEVGHLHYFSEYTAIQTLKDCGYNIKDSFLAPAFVHTMPRNLRQLAVLPFRFLTLAFGKSWGAKIFGGQSLVVFAEK